MGTRRFFFGDLHRAKLYAGVTSALFDPTRFREGFEREWLDPAFVEAVKAKDFSGLVTEHIPGRVYSFPCFRRELCELLLMEIDEVSRQAGLTGNDGRELPLEDHLHRPNGMNRFGLVLNQIGLEPFNSFLQSEYVHPLSKHLFPVEGSQADDHHCFCVRYSADQDTGLDMHEDDSDVTLNVCLGRDFEGATLSFCGAPPDATGAGHRKHACTYSHEVGRAVIHVGRQRHGADDIASGERVNYLLWGLNAEYRAIGRFHEDRAKAREDGEPDRICLSYTHDWDYARYLQSPENDAAERRGVMLHQVKRRRREEEQPVRNLSAPGEEINVDPCLCLFLDRVSDPEAMKAWAAALVAFSEAQRTEMNDTSSTMSGPEPLTGKDRRTVRLPCYCAVGKGGAVPEIRALCHLAGQAQQPASGPALSREWTLLILDVLDGKFYPFEGSVPDGASKADILQDLVRAWRERKLEGRQMAGMPVEE